MFGVALGAVLCGIAAHIASHLFRNIVATVNLGIRLDLKTIAMHARNAEYNPKVCHVMKAVASSHAWLKTLCGFGK